MPDTTADISQTELLIEIRRNIAETHRPRRRGWSFRSSRYPLVTGVHCVTRWSTFDNRWEGVPIREVLSRAKPIPEATHVMAVGHNGDERYGYSTNLPLADLDRDDVLLAMRRKGEDISNEHGGPLRLVVPHLYAWKS